MRRESTLWADTALLEGVLVRLASALCVLPTDSGLLSNDPWGITVRIRSASLTEEPAM